MCPREPKAVHVKIFRIRSRVQILCVNRSTASHFGEATGQIVRTSVQSKVERVGMRNQRQEEWVSRFAESGR